MNRNLLLPSFLIIGAQKSGTSWLHQMLLQHPEIYMPDKEIHFFDKGYNFRRGKKWYSTFFEGADDNQLIGEKTPDYFWTNGLGAEDHLPNVHENIYDVLPDVKLIVSLRNPVDRAVSAVKHIIRSGRVHPKYSIDSLLKGDKQDLVEGHGVLEYGYYYEHLSSYLNYFKRSQILVLIFEEDIKQYPSQGLKKICNFLEIPHFWPSKRNKPVNRNQSSLVELYLNYYSPLMRPLGKMLGRLFPGRLKPPEKATLERLYKHYSVRNEKLFNYLEREVPNSWKTDPRQSEY